MSKHLLLFDSSGFAYRAYFASAPRFRSDGFATHAVTGFMKMVWETMGRAADGDPYDYAAAVFDAPGKTFRHYTFAEYKAGRSRPPALTAQLPLLRDAAIAMGLRTLEVPGFEADDVLATVATIARVRGIRTTLVAVDKDMTQLVIDNEIEIVDPVKKARVLAADVEKKFGVPPSQMIEFQALAGDDVDGIPGVPGVGAKRAASLLRRYGSIAGIMKHVEKGTGTLLTPAVRSALRRDQSNLAIYRTLVTLRTDVPIDLDWEALRPRPAAIADISALLRTLEAEHMIETMFGLSGGKVVFRLVEPAQSDPLSWWRRALHTKGMKIPDVPQCGYYMRKLVKGGEFVACRIWRTDDVDVETGERSGKERLMCEVNGERQDPESQWGFLCSHPITEEVYHKKMGCPPKDPKTPVNWNTAEL